MPLVSETEKNVVEHSAPRKEQILLHHVADAPAQAVHFLSAVEQGALIGIDEAGNDVEDGGFAAAAWANDADEIPFVNVEGQAIENLGLSLFSREAFANSIEPKLDLR